MKRNGVIEDHRVSLRPVERHTAPDADVFTNLVGALAAHDLETCNHSRAVGAWSRRIAKSMKMTQAEQETAAIVGMLHDVGKLAIPAQILLKPGALNAAEWNTMKTHAASGAEMLERISTLREFSSVVRAHHERADGNGYPDGLAGDSIPLFARVVAVADSFHAMISKRPYRNPLTVSEAIVELRCGMGAQWDRSVVEAMLAIVERAEVLPTLQLAHLA